MQESNLLLHRTLEYMQLFLHELFLHVEQLFHETESIRLVDGGDSGTGHLKEFTINVGYLLLIEFQ